MHSWRWEGGGVVKVSCILCHWCIQLILAYSWARLAILVAGKGRGGMFYFFWFFTFIPVPLSSLSLSFVSSTTLLSLSSLSLGWRDVKPQLNQSKHSWRARSLLSTWSLRSLAILKAPNEEWSNCMWDWCETLLGAYVKICFLMLLILVTAPFMDISRSI